MTDATHVHAHEKSITFFVPGDPIPFARAGANGARRFTPKKQRNGMAVARLCAERAMTEAGRKPFEGPVRLTVRATFVIPASWPKKKQAAAHWKCSKPDLDNVVKLIKDAVKSVVWIDDAQVSKLDAEKIYTRALPVGVSVSVEELQPEGIML